VIVRTAATSTTSELAAETNTHEPSTLSKATPVVVADAEPLLGLLLASLAKTPAAKQASPVGH